MTTPPTTLLSFFAHMPAFDSQFPLVERLHHRGHVSVRNIVSRHLLKTEPRVAEAFKAASVPFEWVARAQLEWFSGRAIAAAGAVLTHSDPASGKAMRRRDAQLRKQGCPVILVQHGLMQLGLNYKASPEDRPVALHADLVLLWQDPGQTGAFELKPDARAEVVGLIKSSTLPERAPTRALTGKLAGYVRVVLLCHNYGFEDMNYSASMRDAAGRTWAEVLDSHPETLFVLRPHRGRRKPAGVDLASDLVSSRANAILSDRHSGPFAYSTIEDVLAVSDFVITHPSTVILDAAMAGKPVAVMDNRHALLAGLPQVRTAADIAGFLADPEPARAATAAFRAEFGNISENLTRAAEMVEAVLLSPPVR